MDNLNINDNNSSFLQGSVQTMRVLFAIGNKAAEDMIKTQLIDGARFNYQFVGNAVHKEMLMKLLKTADADILVLREGLQGSDDSIFNLAASIKRTYGKIRIVFIAGDRKIGDVKLGNLVAYNIFDICVGTSVNIKDVVNMIEHPRDFSFASKFLPEKETIITKDDFTNMDISDEPEEEKPKVEIISETLEVKAEKADEKLKANDSILNKHGKNKVGGAIKVIKQDSKELSEIEKKLLEQEKLIQELKRQQEEERKKKLEEEKKKVNPVSVKKPVQKPVPKPIPKKAPEKKPIPKVIPPVRPKPRVSPVVVQKSEYGGKDKIVTFYGSKSGVGTTTVAYATALELAKRRNKVLYIEFNDRDPMVAYWLDIFRYSNDDDGIDKAILGLETNIRADIDSSIVTYKQLMNSGSEFINTLKLLPPTLDFLFFSTEYLSRRDKPNISTESFTNLLMYFMQHLNYNYLILDVNSNSNISLVEQALTFSNKNYITLTQEISTAGYYEQFISVLSRKGLKFEEDERGKKSSNEKNSFIINRFRNDIKMNLRDLKETLETTRIFPVVDNHAEICNKALECIPLSYKPVNRDFQLNIIDIANAIEKN